MRSLGDACPRRFGTGVALLTSCWVENGAQVTKGRTALESVGRPVAPTSDLATGGASIALRLHMVEAAAVAVVLFVKVEAVPSGAW